MKWVLGIAGVVAALWVLDRVALWMERRGWVYWRRTTKSTGANLGSAFLEVHSMLEPGKKHVLEEKRRESGEEEESGDPPEPGVR